ncbi:hypothetical protein [Sciscionella marina]|nr:hypothetical protein [Sciscionella marina]
MAAHVDHHLVRAGEHVTNEVESRADMVAGQLNPGVSQDFGEGV